MTEGDESRPKILLIDNEDSIRSAFESVLTQEGYAVVITRSREEALSRIDEAEFDLIYIVTELDTDSGIDILREIRKKNLPVSVLMLTGDPNAASAREAFKLGVVGHISKPISQEKLLRLTKIALRA